MVATPARGANALHRSWQRGWAGLHAAQRDALRDRLLAAYGHAERAYHTRAHLAQCLALFERHRALAQHPCEVEVALWFHDAVYDPHRADNELRSADWARDELLGAGAPGSVAARVHALVLATRHDTSAATPDARLLVDLDLSILGATPARFARYELQVRQEYDWVDEATFRNARRDVLAGFLARGTLYSTAALRDALEARARANLRASIDRLDAAPPPRADVAGGLTGPASRA